MTQEHLIRPPHELVQQWVSLACENEGYETWQDFATQAARWGADQELEACCNWIVNRGEPFDELDLHNARRPKPPSLKELALEALDQADKGLNESEWQQRSDTIRRALESLPD